MIEAKPSALLGLTLEELTALVEEWRQPSYRGQQLFDAIYRQRVQSGAQISTLPSDFRQTLAEKGIMVGLPAIEKKFASSDGTVRYLLAFDDGQSVETVW